MMARSIYDEPMKPIRNTLHMDSAMATRFRCRMGRFLVNSTGYRNSRGSQVWLRLYRTARHTFELAEDEYFPHHSTKRWTLTRL